MELETKPMDDMNSLTHDVIGAAIEVHRIMGPGLLESVYQSCMEDEFKLRSIECQPQYRFPLEYKGQKLKECFVIDLYFPGQLVVEIKAAERHHPYFEAQLLNYMKLTKTNLGLLLNFDHAVLKDGIKRMKL
jgi:GxxExxY protein